VRRWVDLVGFWNFKSRRSAPGCSKECQSLCLRGEVDGEEELVR